MNQHRYSHIIWDWNGTLLDDVNWCITLMNRMLAKRDKRVLTDVAQYHDAFCFPIFDYYKNVGFDFNEETFETLAEEYMEMYHGQGTNSITLYESTEYVLSAIHDLQIPQIILSASAQTNLDIQINPFGIRHYFDEILGISNIYAKSKLKIGLDYLSRNVVQSGILIGDTTHDFEVSQAMGIECALIAHGHQSKEKLSHCNVPVFDGLGEVLPFLAG